VTDGFAEACSGLYVGSGNDFDCYSRILLYREGNDTPIKIWDNTEIAKVRLISLLMCVCDVFVM
jgi:hypothetical protein